MGILANTSHVCEIFSWEAQYVPALESFQDIYHFDDGHLSQNGIQLAQDLDLGYGQLARAP